MLKSYDDMRKIDVSKYTEKREGAEYLNWAKCIDLLHENGAEKVYFVPVVNEKTGTSLYMTEQEFKDKNGVINRCYETEIKITLDNEEWNFRGPVMNGSNPVKDNSMSQQRLWNSQTRLFVKAIALKTGLGFDLWLKDELNTEKNNWEDDLSKHNIFKIKERCQQIYTQKMKEGLTVKEIADKLHKTEDEVKALFTYFDTLSNFEKELSNIDTKSGQK